jgi:hypothetical protein
MYDKTIGYNHFYFNIVITSTPTTVAGLMDPLDLEEYKNASNQFKNPGNQTNKVAVDGYILADTDYNIAHKADGATETVKANERYTVPVADWIYTTWVYSNGEDISAVLRIISS